MTRTLHPKPYRSRRPEVADAPSVADQLASVHRDRLKAIAKGTWPTWARADVEAHAADARAKKAHGFPLDATDRRALETAQAWADRDARVAAEAARRGRQGRAA